MAETTKASGKPIPDGVYFLQAEGSAWIAARFHRGEMIAQTEEANADTHLAARDAWAGIRPGDGDDLLDVTDEQLAIDVALACGYDDAHGVSVSRACE